MKEMSGKMSDMDLIHALRRMAPETGSLHCLGCGYEHKCSLKGCAIIRLAVERLEKLTALEPNASMTLEELREMDGDPVWVVPIDSPHQRPGWMQVMSEFNIVARHESMAKSVYARFSGYGNEWIAYRRKPEEATE